MTFVPKLRAAVERLARQWHVYDYLVDVSGPLGGSVPTPHDGPTDGHGMGSLAVV